MSYSPVLCDLDPLYGDHLSEYWAIIGEEIEQELAAMRAGYSSFSACERAYQELWEETQELERLAPKVGEPCFDV
jgi:hypothetical protein